MNERQILLGNLASRKTQIRNAEANFKEAQRQLTDYDNLPKHEKFKQAVFDLPQKYDTNEFVYNDLDDVAFYRITITPKCDGGFYLNSFLQTTIHQIGYKIVGINRDYDKISITFEKI